MINLPQVVMTTDSTWDPTCQDTDHLSTQELVAQFPTTPVAETDAFCNQEGDVADTGSYRSSQASSRVSNNHTNCTDNALGLGDAKNPDSPQASYNNPVTTQNRPHQASTQASPNALDQVDTRNLDPSQASSKSISTAKIDRSRHPFRLVLKRKFQFLTHLWYL